MAKRTMLIACVIRRLSWIVAIPAGVMAVLNERPILLILGSGGWLVCQAFAFLASSVERAPKSG